MTPREIAYRIGQLALATAKESENNPQREELERISSELLAIKSRLSAVHRSSHKGAA